MTQYSLATPQSDYEDTITAAGFLLRAWAWRWPLLGFVVAFALAAGIYAFLAQPQYTASILIGPVRNPQENSGGSTPQLGGIASLLGRSGGSENDEKLQLFLTVIKTRNFATHLYEKRNMAAVLSGRHGVDSASALQGKISKIVVISDAASGTISLSLDFPDRDLAKTILNEVYQDANIYLREMDTKRAQSYVSYIENRFRSETNTTMKDALLNLLLSQERFLMMTKVDQPYAATLLDGPNVSNTPTSPRKLLLIALGVLAGLVAGIAVMLVWDTIRLERTRRKSVATYHAT